MKILYTFLSALILLLLEGCATTDTYLKPVTACAPLSAYKEVVLSPISYDSVFILERKYAHVPAQISGIISDNLKENLESTKSFNTVSISQNCKQHAIKLETNIYQLIHRKGKYHVGIRGQVINCDNGQALYRFNEEDESDSEIRKIPSQIADHLADGIRANLTCAQTNAKN